MSSAGQIVGGAVGAVAGFFLGGNVATGAQIGMMLGGLLDPPKGPTVTGPRLTDLTIQTSTYGAVIPRLYGTTSVHGNVFWLENNKIKETVVKKKSGGKGGPKTTTKTYVNTATFALGLCRGPIAGVRRIWISGKLYYDAGSTDTDTIIASNQAASGFTVHTGTDTQMPDTRMQATLGAANTPAWRGFAYIVFNDLPLADYGDALSGAQIKVEVVQTATYGDDQYSYTPPSSRWLGLFKNNGFLWSVGGQSMASGNQVCYSSDGGQNWSSNTALDFTSYWIAAGANSNLYLALAGYGDGRVARSTNLTSWTTVSGPDAWWRNIIVNGSTFLCFGGYACYTTTDGVNFTSGTNPSSAVVTTFVGAGTYNGSVYAISLEAVAGVAKIAVSTTGLNGWTETVVSGFSQTYGVSTGPGGMLISSGSVPTLSGKHCITTSVDNGATWSPYIELPFANSNLQNVVWNGAQYMAIELNYNYFYTSPDLVTWERHTTIQGGLYYGPPVWDGAYWNHLRNNANEPSTFIRFRTGVLSASTNPTLGDIVNAECLLSRVLDSGDITTSGLTSEVRGYLVGSVGTLRNALVPLQAAWPFDVVQRGYKVEFIPRGGASVATLLSDDLDAHQDTGKPGVQITMPREMDTQLPRVLTIKYMDYDREYDIGEQYAERLNTDSVNEEVQELPIVMLASEAAGKAEVLLYVRWMERTDVSVVVPGTYNHLEVGDTVTLQTPEGNVAIRITAANYTSDGRVEIKAKFAHSAVYTPAALGVPSVVSGVSTIPSSGPSRYVLLDVPYMDTAQGTPSFLATMYGGSGWPGGVLVRTDDGGTTWTDVQAFDSAGGTVGSASNTIGVVDSRVWDKTSVLSVTMNNGTLSSATEAAVLNGGNYFAYGLDGRWEIIAAQTCTLVSGSTYTLQNLLRGRFGTEWAMGLHAAGDTIVALNTSDVTAIGMSSSSIGLSRAYRGITYGQDISSDSDRDFTYRGVNLECLSPVHFTGYRSIATSDWIFSCVRRSRTDGEWRDLVDAGLGETSEAYELDICTDATYATVKRTISSATLPITYTYAQQVSDFGTTVANAHARIHQMSSVVGRGYGQTGSFAATSGNFWAYVVMQMQMNGSIGSASFTEVKGKTVSAFGDTKHMVSDGLYGSSCYFDGSGDYLLLSSTSDFDLGSGAMTIEFWVYRESHLTDARVLQFGPNGSASSCQVNFRSDGGIWFFPATGSPASGFSVGAGNYSLSTWTHIAFVLTSTTAMRLYVNGVEKYNSTASAFPSASYQLSVGGDSGLDLKGNVCGLRITKGVARYTSAFTPPSTMHVEGTSDPYWANVVLSMPLTSNTSDTKGKSVSVNGTPAISSARSPFSRVASFDGTGDYLTVPTGTDLVFGTDDFTIEMWIYRTADMSAGTYRLYNCWDGSTGILFAVVNNNIYFRYNNGTNYEVTGPATSINTWHYVTVRKSGTTLTVAKDTVFSSITVAGSVPCPVSDTYIGRASDGASQYFIGRIGPIRVIKGAAPDLSTIPSLPLATS